ncbi:hypothetical protein Taro_010475 [Colocasia esculenta]|uniref:F-box/LRR-repeat protein 15-like leucin rich repeat domain-containing protein n=1 Tax=Colocasia esculenta TaxID=4460 RepID=A0A843U7P2_COLES|nr:hypothetical protein [Colocasia esculenta]
MTVLRSREVPPPSPLPRTPTKRTPRKNSPPLPASADALGPPTPSRADAPSTGGPRTAAANALGFRAPSPVAPRRSSRLASRSAEAAAVESGASGMGEEGKEGRGRSGKRGWDASGAGWSASRSEEGEEGGGIVGFDLNLPAVESPSGTAKKRRERGKAVDPTVSSESISEEPTRMEVIEIESDGAQEEVDMVASRGRRYSSSEKGKGIMVEDDAPSFSEKGKGIMVEDDAPSFSEKGKGIMAEDDAPSVAGARFYEFLDGDRSPVHVPERDSGEEDNWAEGGTIIDDEKGMMVLVQGKWLTMGDLGVGWVPKTEHYHVERDPAVRRKESDRRKAKELAPKFAFFKPEEEDDSEEGDSSGSPKDDPADWPGPFSTAVKIINDREKRLESRQLRPGSALFKSSELRIEWVPSSDPERGCLKRLVPSLRDLAVRALSENAAEIESLDGVPNELRHQLSGCICKRRTMDEHVLDLFVRGSPTEIRVPDCSWASEEEFERIFVGANTDQLAVLQLDLCGRCLPDYILSSTLARSPNKLPSLTTVSLRGAYRLSDDGLDSLASAAPLLSSIDLGECSLITSTGITSLVEKLNPVLRELYLDDCHIDAMFILPALMNLKKLKVLSVAGIESVTNQFVHHLVSVHGASLKELVFTGCKRLTTASVKAIGEKCLQLRSLDLRDLVRLDDYALVHLANGCTSFQKLMLRHNPFRLKLTTLHLSDKAVAALLEASGGSLTELSLNNIREVSNFTAQAIAIRCSLTLRMLDLSFCRKTTDEVELSRSLPDVTLRFVIVTKTWFLLCTVVRA